MEDVIDEYRYVALMLGTFFEGETAIIVASSLIHKGLFNGPYTVLYAFAGSFISDWIYFLAGRLNGRLFVERRPRLRKMIEPLNGFLIKNRLQILLTYRFLYGFRVVIPVLIGMSRLSPRVFLFYSGVTGLFWAAMVSLFGYFLGHLFNVSVQSLSNNLLPILLTFATFGLLLGYTVKRIVQWRLHVGQEGVVSPPAGKV